VEKPRTDDTATTAEGRQLPEVKPPTEVVEAPVAQAEEQPAGKRQIEDKTKLDESGGKG
jgi:hypothetical protein